MTSFFNQYKGLFIDNGSINIPSFTYPPRFRDNLFQFQLRQIQQKMKYKQRSILQKYSIFSNPQSELFFKQRSQPKLNYFPKLGRNMSLANIEVQEPKIQIKQFREQNPVIKSSLLEIKPIYDKIQQRHIKLPSLARPTAYSSVDTYSTQSNKYGNKFKDEFKQDKQQNRSSKLSNYHQRNRVQNNQQKTNRIFKLDEISINPQKSQIKYPRRFKGQYQNKILVTETNNPTILPSQKAAKTQPDQYYTPKLNRKHQRRHITQQQTEPNIFMQFDEQHRPINNYQFLDKRMHDIKKIDTYYDRQKLNSYTNVLLRRRDIKKNLLRKQKLKDILDHQAQLSYSPYPKLTAKL